MLTTARAARPDRIDYGGFPVPTRRELRLLVVDDHPAVRVGLERLLGEEPDFQVEIDVAIVDYHLGGRNGLWVSRMLKRLPHPPRVIVFSAFANDHLAANCIVAGADALLSKGSLGSELCDTVRLVARGRRPITKVPQPMAEMLRRRLDGIEQPIFGMLLAGISRAEIDRTLRISADERASHETAMLSKLERLPGEHAGW
jgi:DNA-binding NarL/FixJ family response regulator